MTDIFVEVLDFVIAIHNDHAILPFESILSSRSDLNKSYHF